jgi:arginine decarboxylase
VVLLDRNCHKSIVNSVIQTGAIPVWLQSARNALGLIGPIRAADLDPAAIRAKMAANPLLSGRAVQRARLAVVTNSTYDGIMYDAAQLIACLGQVAEHVLLDEAWIPYAAFHPMYAGHFGMSGPRNRDPEVPTVITTMSTHKMLAALSQASMIHIRQGRSPLPRPRFNEAFMLHTSTSPQYGIVASLDVATKMMEGAAGRSLVDDAISEAIGFRQEMANVGTRMSADGSWWFGVFQPQLTAQEPEGDGRDVQPPVLRQDTWQLAEDRSWHGFHGLLPGEAMLAELFDFAALVGGQTEQVPLDSLEGRVSAVTCLLYPPGIPVVVQGERFDAHARPIIDYLQLSVRWDEHFPGFENEVQGVVRDRLADGTVRFTVSCVTEAGSN